MLNLKKRKQLSNDMDFDFENDFYKHQLYKQLVAYYCKGCSSAFLTDYDYNKILQELTTEVNYLKHSDVVDLERSKGYTNELEKIIRNDNNLNETINLKTAVKKNEAKGDRLFSR